MDDLEFRLAKRDFQDALDDILDKHPDLRDDPNAHVLITNNALAMAQAEIQEHGRFVSSPREYAKRSVAKTREYLGKKDEPAPERTSAHSKGEDEPVQWTKEDFADFYRDMGDRVTGEYKYSAGARKGE